jgi:hypothetical protein
MTMRPGRPARPWPDFGAPTHPDADTDDPDLALAIWRTRAARTRSQPGRDAGPAAAVSERDNRLPGRDHP